jgi:uncharacterized protein YggE
MKFFWLLLASVFCFPVTAEPLPLPPQAHIVVEGLGTVERVPDIVELDIDIRKTANNFAEAKKQVDDIIKAAIQAANKHGVKSEDINASQIQATPQYQWHDKEKIYKGEQVSRQLHIKLKEPEHYSALVNALLDSGVSRLNRARFSFSNQAELQQLALQQAIDNAREQALTITSHMNISLGPVFQIAPVGPVAYSGARLMKMADSESTDSGLKPGKQTIRQQIRVVYLLAEP